MSDRTESTKKYDPTPAQELDEATVPDKVRLPKFRTGIRAGDDEERTRGYDSLDN